MNLPKNILVPTDFSEGAEAALNYAVALAAKLDARVHLLNVVTLPMLGADAGFMVTPSMMDEVLGGNQKALDALVAARTGLCEFGPAQIEVGDARGQIEEIARKVGADLIVMGTHGRRGFRRLLLGSVAEAIVRVSPCPVLLVRHDEP
jgi:nucleotide-binding universal stress UspA family protein